MADEKITDYGANGSPAAGDLIEIIDISDTSMAPTGTNKKLRYDQFIASTFGTFGNQVYVSGVNGNDANSGLTPTAAKQTIPAGATTVEAMGGGGTFRGAVCLDSGPNPLSAQFIMPESVSLLGNHRHANFGFETLYDNGSWIEWTGINPASASLTTGSVLRTSAFARGGVIKHVSFNLGTGNMSNLRAIDMVDWQNMSLIEDVLIKGANFNIGFCAYNKTSIGAPGFYEMQQCWCAGGARVPFLFGGIVEQITLRGCKVDDGNSGATSRAVAGYQVGPTGVSDEVFAGGSSGILILDGCANEMGGTTTGDYPDISVVATTGGHSYDVALDVRGFIQQSDFTVAGGLTTPAISYLATPSEPDDVLPVFVSSYVSQSRAHLISAPNAIGGAVTVNPGTPPAAGHRTRWKH